MDVTEGPKGKQPFQLGEIRVDPQSNVLSGPSGDTALEPKVMAVLVQLVEANGEVVEREEFMSTIWAHEYSGDESLTRAISLLRKTLGDIRGSRQYIETIPRKGYRLRVTHSAPPKPTVTDLWRRANVWFISFLLIALSLFLWRLGSGPGEVTEQNVNPIVAVLPFTSMSSEPGEQRLAEGLAEDILSRLTRSGTLNVIAGSSSFRFRSSGNQDLAQLKEQLNVSHVLQGSVQQVGGDLRIGVNLTETATGRVSWSENLTRPVADLFDTADTIVSGVLSAVGQGPSHGAPNPSPQDPVAIRKYLEAKALMREDITRSELIIALLEDVVAQEPEFAQAWADLAIVRLSIIFARPGSSTSGYRNRDPEERLFQVRKDAQKALSLDSSLPEARLALMVVDYRARLLPLDQAERQFRQVVDDYPYYSDAHRRFGLILVELGYLEESLHHFRRAWELDPLSLQPASVYLQFAVETGETAEAESLLYQGRFPWYRNSYYFLYYALIDKNYARAIGWLEEAQEVGQFGPHGAWATPSPDAVDFNRLIDLFDRLVQVASTGQADSNPGLSEDFIRAADDGLILHYYVAIMLAVAGYQDAAFELVKQRLAIDDLYIRGALYRRAFQSIREDPRVMAWFDVGTQLDYWLQTDHWPDFCREPSLPYDCREEARKFRDLPADQ